MSERVLVDTYWAFKWRDFSDVAVATGDDDGKGYAAVGSVRDRFPSKARCLVAAEDWAAGKPVKVKVYRKVKPPAQPAQQWVAVAPLGCHKDLLEHPNFKLAFLSQYGVWGLHAMRFNSELDAHRAIRLRAKSPAGGIPNPETAIYFDVVPYDHAVHGQVSR